MNQENVGASAQGELFKRRRGEIPDAEKVSITGETISESQTRAGI